MVQLHVCILKSGVEWLSKKRQWNFWTKCYVVSWPYIEIKLFLYRFKSLVCTQMTCQNQVNVLAVFFFFWFAKYFAHDEHAFIGQSEMFFLRILPEVSDPWCWPKGSQPLRTRLGAVCNWVKCAFVLGHFSIPENNSKNSLSKSIAQQARFTVEIETENSLSWLISRKRFKRTPH